jgi:hypothetical protein
MRIALVTDAWLPHTNGVTGVLSEYLRTAALAVLQLDRRACHEHALRYTWEAATRQFVASLAPAARLTPRIEPWDMAAQS